MGVRSVAALRRIESEVCYSAFAGGDSTVHWWFEVEESSQTRGRQNYDSYDISINLSIQYSRKQVVCLVMQPD
jgi:hypothetical protein